MTRSTVQFSLLPLLAAMILLFVPIDVTMGQTSGPAAPASANEKAGTFSSVIVQLDQDRDDFKKLMDQIVSPKMKKIQDRFRADTRKVAQIAAKLKENPSSKDLQAEFEDHLSSAIAHWRAYLMEFAASEQETMEGIARFKATMENAAVSAAADQEASRERVTELDAQVNQFDEKLDALAQRFASEVSAGKPLPPEVDAQIVQLDDAMRIVQMQRAIFEQRSKHGQAVSGALLKNAQSLDHLQTKLQGDFRRATGHIAVLDSIAAYRLNLVNNNRINENFKAIHAAFGSHSGRSSRADLDKLMKEVMSTDFGIATAGETTLRPGAGSGRDVLLLRLHAGDNTLTKKEAK